jgi:phosphocarrier protein HPr
MEKIRELYKESVGKEPGKKIILDDGIIRDSIAEFMDHRGGSQVDQGDVQDEQFIDLYRTSEGYEIHMLSRHKDEKGNVNAFYFEEDHLVAGKFKDFVEDMAIGDHLTLYNSGDDPLDLTHKVANYVAPNKELTEGLPSLDNQLNYSANVLVENQYGVHARPAALIVKMASEYDCDAYITKDDREVSAKSIMGVMTLGADKGTDLLIRTEESYGSTDAEKCLDDLVDLINSKFGEE